MKGIFILLLFVANNFASCCQTSKSYDIMIYGGTSAGISATIQAASHMGKTVVLIEPGSRIGGLTTGGSVNQIFKTQIISFINF